MRVFSVYEYIWCVRNKNNYINKIINNEQLANQYIDLIVCYFLVSVVPWKMWIEGVTRPLRTKRIVVFFLLRTSTTFSRTKRESSSNRSAPWDPRRRTSRRVEWRAPRPVWPSDRPATRWAGSVAWWNWSNGPSSIASHAAPTCGTTDTCTSRSVAWNWPGPGRRHSRCRPPCGLAESATAPASLPTTLSAPVPLTRPCRRHQFESTHFQFNIEPCLSLSIIYDTHWTRITPFSSADFNEQRRLMILNQNRCNQWQKR